MFNRINKIMEEKGKLLRGGTVVDATIIEAPISTKNQEGKRDDEMLIKQKKVGNGILE